LKLEDSLAIERQMSSKFVSFFVFCKLSKRREFVIRLSSSENIVSELHGSEQPYTLRTQKNRKTDQQGNGKMRDTMTN